MRAKTRSTGKKSDEFDIDIRVGMLLRGEFRLRYNSCRCNLDSDMCATYTERLCGPR